jgi:hypothetical protein
MSQQTELKNVSTNRIKKGILCLIVIWEVAWIKNLLELVWNRGQWEEEGRQRYSRTWPAW